MLLRAFSLGSKNAERPPGWPSNRQEGMLFRCEWGHVAKVVRLYMSEFLFRF